ncbi:MAG: ABC transporter permease [Oxalobacter sp.]|nr:MAG: ABC transporter permease [Oxalobacter sp.]
MKTTFSNIFRLGVKELHSLWADKVMLFLICWAFTGAVYSAAMGVSQELRNAPVAVVDEDRSPLSQRLIGALTPPYFKTPESVTIAKMDSEMDHGYYSFGIVIPANFQRDLEAGRRPAIQVNIDATVMSQSFIGASYIQNIFSQELNEYLTGKRESTDPPIQLATRVRFNPNLTGFWFGGVMEVVGNVTMLTIILVGAAVIREREHGTLEHLLVMPLTPFEIMMAKIWANGVVVLLAASVGLMLIIRTILQVPIAGSVPLFLCGAALYLFSAASIGIFLGTLARSMPQLGLLMILTIIPLKLLTGGVTPRESMPEIVQWIMSGTPTTYFVKLAQDILYRGAGFSTVWPHFLAIIGIGTLFFLAAMARFRRSVTQTQL